MINKIEIEIKGKVYTGTYEVDGGKVHVFLDDGGHAETDALVNEPYKERAAEFNQQAAYGLFRAMVNGKLAGYKEND